MAYPEDAVEFTDRMDSHELLDFIIPMGSVLEEGETIDPDPGRWSLALLAEAAALGLEIIESDPDWPDPYLITGDARFPDHTAIRFWARFDPAFQGNAAFLPGARLPMEASAWTSSTPPRHRQRTAILVGKEQ